MSIMSATTLTITAPSRDVAEDLLFTSVKSFEAYSETLPEPLARMLCDIRDRWVATSMPDHTYARFFLGAGGTPAFQLLAWLVESLFPQDTRSTLAASAGEAMLCYYFAVRCQDDRVDEGADPKLTYLEEALLARVVRLLVTISGDAPRMLAEWESLCIDFGAAGQRDAVLRSDPLTHWDDEAMGLQGRKYLPMAAPLMAIMLAAGRAEELPALRRTIERLGAGLQLSNDIFGLERDLATKQGSPFLAALELQPGRHSKMSGLPAVRRAIRRGDFLPLFERAAASLRSGLEPLAHLSSERLARHVDKRIEELEACHRRFSLRALFHVPELVADLEITRRCNLRCPACFVFAQEDAPNHKLPELPTSLLLALLEELGGYRTNLHLTGGEAFLHHGIWQVLEAAATHGMTEVLINTNGSLLNEERMKRLAALPVTVRLLVSIDGPPGVQETARGTGMTKKALDAIRLAARMGVKAEPATILTSELVDYGVDRWFDWLTEELGRKPSLTLWPIFLQPDVHLSLDEGGSMLDAAHLQAAAEQIARLMLAPADVVVADYPVINPLLARHGVPRDRLWQCNAGRGRLAVQADGMLTPCHPFLHSLGALSEQTVRGFVDRVLEHPDYVRMGKREHEGCSSCPEQEICGNCQAVVVGKGGKLFSNDHVCDTVIGPLAARTWSSGARATKVVRLPLLA
jgi:radical SAM protein with 4Fe4S-binding SPASM domain